MIFQFPGIIALCLSICSLALSIYFYFSKKKQMDEPLNFHERRFGNSPRAKVLAYVIPTAGGFVAWMFMAIMLTLDFHGRIWWLEMPEVPKNFSEILKSKLFLTGIVFSIIGFCIVAIYGAITGSLSIVGLVIFLIGFVIHFYNVVRFIIAMSKRPDS